MGLQFHIPMALPLSWAPAGSANICSAHGSPSYLGSRTAARGLRGSIAPQASDAFEMNSVSQFTGDLSSSLVGSILIRAIYNYVCVEVLGEGVFGWFVAAPLSGP